MSREEQQAGQGGWESVICGMGTHGATGSSCCHGVALKNEQI